MSENFEELRLKKLEFLLILIISVLLLGFRVYVASNLRQLGVFDQYNVFFDSDPNQYVSAISGGWGFGRSIHPAFALLINIPVRVFDYLAAHAGILEVGAVRGGAPLLVSPFFTSVAGILWWLAARKSGFSRLAGVAGFLLLQFSFSQTVFSVIPESYGVSGALLAALLLFVVTAARRPETLTNARVRARWLFLACLMSGVTVTNGFLCLAVWFAIRVKRENIRMVIAEVIVAGIVLGCVIAAMGATDRMVYRPVQAANSKSGVEVKVWVEKYLTPSVARRFVEVPAVFVASVFTIGVTQVENTVAKTENRHQFQFSFVRLLESKTFVAFGWIFIAGLGELVWRKDRGAVLTRAIAAIFIFNITLHTFFGLEVFLYSQHWLAFLTFAMILPVSGSRSKTSILILLILVLAGFSLSFNTWLGMHEALNSSVAI
ncbi:hypothetical protein WG899_20575 [Paucibacter sp. AS339]|uniref:hypothetical protein n=1 Tax=Paucibacter hankyongi TaxID=3133434 RepID=UPI003099A33C